MEKQIELEKDLTEIFDEEYEKRNLITPKNTAEKLTAKGYQKQVEWISVEDRLPTETGTYIVTDMTEYRPTIWMQKFKAEGRWFPSFKAPCFVYFDNEVYVKSRKKITHWMRLPKLPQMKGE